MNNFKNNILKKTGALLIGVFFMVGSFVNVVVSEDARLGLLPSVQNVLDDDVVQLSEDKRGEWPSQWSDWCYRRNITIDHEKVSADFVNFPVLISFPSDFDLVNDLKCQDGGGDFVFTDDAENQLAHEIEFFDESSGELVAWVNVTYLSSVMDTTISMYYGNPSCASQENPEGVWDSSYRMVHHLDESSGSHVDSTFFGNDGSYSGMLQDTSGQVYGADGFDGVDDYVLIQDQGNADLVGGSSAVTVSSWVYIDSGSDRRYIFHDTWEGMSTRLRLEVQADDTLIVGVRDTASVAQQTKTTVSALPENEWLFVTVVVDIASDSIDIFVNGDEVASTGTIDFTNSVFGSDTSMNTVVGASGDYLGSTLGPYSFDGVLDEVRVSTIVRSADWILTKYNNQHSPSAFYMISEEESLYPEPNITLVSPSDNGSEYNPVTFSYTPECFVPDGCKRAELWLNSTEQYNGSLAYSDSTYYGQRGLIKGGKLYQTEGIGSGVRIVVRSYPDLTILDEGPVFGSDGWTNTAPVVDGDVVYGVCTSSEIQAYNVSSDSVEWEISVSPYDSRGLMPNCMQLYDGHLLVQSGNFIIHKIDKNTGVEVSNLSLNYSGGVDSTGYPLRANMILDDKNDRLYALGESRYYCLNASSLDEIWNVTIVEQGGWLTRGGPILVNDSFSEQYLTIFTTYPQDYTYAFDYDGNEVWNWTDQRIRAVPIYNPNTGLVYLNEIKQGYTSDTTGAIYALYVNNGTQKWRIESPDNDYFSRPMSSSGNYLVAKTDNANRPDSVWVIDAMTGEFLSKVTPGHATNCWCFPPAISGGFVTVGGGAGTLVYQIGDGEWVDYYPYQGNQNHTGYVENALTSAGFLLENWEMVKINETPILNDTLNDISFDFLNYSLPQNVTWNIRLVQSDGQHVWGRNRTLRVLPVNQSPVISDPSPVDGELNVPVDLEELSVEVGDPEGDEVTWSIKTSPDIGGASGSSELDGLKVCCVSGLSSGTVYTWFVNVSDSGSGMWTNESFSFTTAYSLSDWQYRKEIVIDHSQVDADLQDFPILLGISDDMGLADYAQDDFADVLFTNGSVGWLSGSSADRLNHEIESYDDEDGNLTVWVNVTELSGDVDTCLYMYYGNPICGSQENLEGVWDSSYRMVHHLDESSGSHVDSTLFGNDGSYSGMLQDTSGQVDGADGFDGSDDYVLVQDQGDVDLVGGSSAVSVSGWIYLDVGSGRRYILHDTWEGMSTRLRLEVQDDDTLIVGVRDTASAAQQTQTTSAVLPEETWLYVCAVVDVVGDTIDIFVNGDEVASTGTIDFTNSVFGSDTSMNTVVGASGDYLGDVLGPYSFDGVLDEVRVSTVARDSSWIKTKYHNQVDVESFFDVGFEEMVPSGDVIPPEISDVSVSMSDPLDTVIGWENVSCVVTDDVSVYVVRLNMTFPDGHSDNVSMARSGDTFYHNVTLADEGAYSYYVWVNDTRGNQNSSASDWFELPPNWDINIDHQCSIVDLIQVANHFDLTGPSGWIREDVDNNGDVSIVDLIQIANHFDETW